MAKGILLDTDNDLKVNVKRDSNGLITDGLTIGDRKMQDTYMVLSMNQGDLKEDPLAGANLIKMIRGRENKEKIRKTVEIALGRVGIKFEDVKEQIELLLNKKKI